MRSTIISTTSDHISSGGTITGDLTISGDLTVSGGGSLSFDEILEGTQVIDVTDTEAFLVRKNGDGGDVFIVDSTNTRVGIGKTPTSPLHIYADDNTKFQMVIEQDSASTGDAALKFDLTGVRSWLVGLDNSDSDKFKICADANDLNDSTFLTIDTSGSVGIGTAAPTEILHIESSAAGKPILLLNNTNADANSSTIQFTKTSGSQADNDSLGMIDFVGKRDTGALVSFARIAGLSQDITIGDDAGELRFQVSINNNAAQFLNLQGYKDGTGAQGVGGGSIIFNEDSFDVDFRVESDNNANAFFIQGSSGNVGIGVSDPDQNLEVSDTSANSTIAIERTDGMRLELEAQIGQARISTKSATDLYLQTDTTPVMVLKSGGNVGIGTAAPDSLFSIDANSGDNNQTNYMLRLDADQDNASHNAVLALGAHSNSDASLQRGAIQAYIADGSNVGSLTLQESGGNVGIGVTNPDSILEINSADDVTTTALKVLALDDGGYTGTVMEVYGTRGPNSAYNIAKFGTNAGTAKVVIRGDGNVGIGTHVPAAVFDVSPIQYSTGSASQSGTTVTGSGTTWTAAMIGSIFLYADGTSSGVITARASNTSITVTTSQTVSSQGYSIHYRVMKLDNNSRISLSNNDSGGTGGADSTSGNTLFGYLAGEDIADGGRDNTLLGHGSGKNITTGDENVIIGSEAGATLVGAIENTVVGMKALYSDDAGDGTTVVGHKALYYQNVGDEISANTAVGRKAGWYNITGKNNTYLGYNAGYGADSQSNSNNVGVGSSALKTINDGEGNVAIGTIALELLTTGDSNIGIGWAAGDSITTANSTVFIGTESGSTVTVTNSTTSDGTVGIGHQALKALTSGTGNVAVGYEALMTADDGVKNTAIGHAALKLNDNVNGKNTAVGYHAATTLGSAYMNTIIGAEAADELTTGISNTVVGARALGVADGGEARNIAIGADCMSGVDNDLSTYNVAIGTEALVGGTGALVGNIAIGANALDATSNQAQTGTIAIGQNALTALTSGEKNTAIGYNAGAAMTTSDGNTIIGYNAYAAGNNADTTGHNVMIGSGVCDTGTDANIRENVFIGYEVAAAVTSHAALKNTGVGKACFATLTSGTENIAIGRGSGSTLSTGSGNIYIGNDNVASAAGATSEYVIGKGVTGSGNNTTTIGNKGVFKFASKSYTCQYSDGEDEKSASGDSTPIKLPAYSIIKSISVVVTQLSDLATFNVALYHSTDSGAVADNTALGGTPVEVLGAGEASGATCSGTSASAVDIALGTSAGVVKTSYYNAYGGNGLPVGAADRYIHVGQAGTSNGDTNPSGADGIISVLVEYVGLD